MVKVVKRQVVIMKKIMRITLSPLVVATGNKLFNYLKSMDTGLGTNLLLPFHQNVKDALSSASVPTVREFTLLPLMSGNVGDAGTEFVRVFADEDVGTDTDGLDVFGVAVEGDARHVVEGRLLSDIAGVGDDAGSMSCERLKL